MATMDGDPVFLDSSLLIAASVKMLTNGVKHVATRNARDFKRYSAEIGVDSVAP